MKSWEVLAAFIALAAGLWGQVKMVITWVKGLVVVTVWTDDQACAIVVNALGSGRHSSHDRLFSASTSTWVKPLNRYTTITWECLAGSSRTFWFDWRPIWYSHPKESKNASHPHSFSFVRGTVDWEKLLTDSAKDSGINPGYQWAYKIYRHHVVYHFGKNLGSELAEQRAHNNGKALAVDEGYTVMSGWNGDGNRLLGWEPKDIGKDKPTGTFNSLSLSNELLGIVAELKRWLELRDWYADRGIPWKRGYLFHGAPGTGKTAFARAASEELDLPVHVFDLATMSNADLREEWGKMLKSTPCMVVLEDIDGVFHGRENVSPSGGGVFTSGGLTIDALLNCIDGVERTDGVLLVVTSNHPEHVDEALANRPGRIDRVVEFKPLDMPGRIKLAIRILGDEAWAHKVALDSGGVPASKFVEICCRAALDGVFQNQTEDPYR